MSGRQASRTRVRALLGFALGLALVVVYPNGSSRAGALPDPFVLVAAGDIACDPISPHFNGGRGTDSRCQQLATSRLLRNADRVMPLGDAQYQHGSLANFMQSYDLSWGRYRSISRPVVGNHEYGPPIDPDLGADGYWDYFGTHRAGAVNRGWHSFNLGNWHVIGLNSLCRSTRDPTLMQPKVGCGRDSRQVRWLRRDLAESRGRKCIVAAWHHPRFTSGYGGPWRELIPIWKVLDEAGADVVLTGHEHSYERFARQTAGGRRTAQGIRQFVVGTGGNEINARFDSLARHSQVRRLTHGVLKLRLRAASYTWKFVQIGGQVLDRGSAPC